MATALTQFADTVIAQDGPRLKKFGPDECLAMGSSGILDFKGLKLLQGDILENYGLQRRHWTVDEIEALRTTGALDVDRLELIEGELYDKMGKNRPHTHAVQTIARVLYRTFGLDRVTTESVIQALGPDSNSSKPEPDIVVTHRDYQDFQGDPLPQEVSLLVEVSDSTLRFDLRTKAALYARCEIPEYWVVDLNSRALIVHRVPRQGTYTEIRRYTGSESVRPLGAPRKSVPVSKLFQ